MVGLINYGSGNIYAIANIYKRLNIPHFLSNKPDELIKANKLILPGVGAFDETMALLNNLGLKDFLDELVLHKKIPILGVCVGMQILGNNSEEGILPGFGWISGQIKKLNSSALSQKPFLPHLGWNSIEPTRPSALLKDTNLERGFYFLHNYFFECENSEDSLATTNYGNHFSSAINKDNVYGVQFHPEKSHSNGITLFKNFAEL